MRCVCLLALVFFGLLCPQGWGDQPNIIFLLADDQNTLSVGCYGNKEVKTPHIDRLGAEGVIFERHYDTTAICMASRASIFTGRYEYQTGCNFGNGDLAAALWEKSYPILLRKAGYLTAFAGKFGIAVEGKGICAADFDFYGGGPGQTHYETAKNPNLKRFAKEYPHSTLAYGAFGCEVIRESVKRKKPFCLSISFKAPHRPVAPDPKFDDIYRGQTFTKPPNFGRQYGEHLSEQSKQGRQFERFHSWGYSDRYDEVMAKYYQQIYAIDVALGRLRDELEKQGVADNTVIIYTSDNGFICGSHGYGSKVLPMEESSRVPLIIHDPRGKNAGKGLRCARLTGNIDFAPTLMALAGVEPPEGMDGKSLVPLLENPEKGGHESLALINVFPPAATTSLSIVAGDHKYTYWWFENETMKASEELFDLRTDPFELTNLADGVESEGVLEEMRRKYDDRLKHWKAEMVNEKSYRRYVTLFDRKIPMSGKKKLLKSPRRR